MPPLFRPLAATPDSLTFSSRAGFAPPEAASLALFEPDLAAHWAGGLTEAEADSLVLADMAFDAPTADAGETPAAATVVSQGATGNAYLDGLLWGTKWTGTVTYSFPLSGSDYAGYPSTEPTTNFRALTPQGREATRAIMDGTSGATANVQKFGNLASLVLAPMTQDGTNGGFSGLGDIRLAESTAANPTAYAYYPFSDAAGRGGDVWFGTAYAGTALDYRVPVAGGYSYFTYIHELGHALGLKHAHEAGGVANVAVPTNRDSLEYTVMTYRSAIGGSTTSGYSNETWGAPQTWMQLDIQALQLLYGADYATNSGDTTYTWSSTTGQMFVNGAGQGTPGGNRIFLTIWDGGGNDTYDMSNYTTAVNINLTPGGSSITAEAQRAQLTGSVKAGGNVYNSLLYNGDARSAIENAVGGSGNDTLTGNTFGNLLKGNRGNDTLIGGGGVDVAAFDGTMASHAITEVGAYSNALHARVVNATNGTDSLYGISILQFADGFIWLNDGSSTFDSLFYGRRYGDVFAAKVAPIDHYMASGWQEGRDPSAFFSTGGYFRANADVRAAGVNPVMHYDNSGWREGRDPGLTFDTQGYLGLHGDVRAAGLNPLAHYMDFGRFEGRATAKMVGNSDGFGFDAPYYLMANPDVAAAGVDPASHFYNSGWREGRAASNHFDSAGYLAKYADVRNAGVNPLVHYMQNGWRENRDPSAGFDTSLYRTNYGDVAAAQINPLLHYLTSGINEGRVVFSDGFFD